MKVQFGPVEGPFTQCQGGCGRKLGLDTKDKKWEHVRHFPVNILASDEFNGSEEYGNPDNNKVAWARKFDKTPFGKIKILSGEKFKNPYVKEYTKEEFKSLSQDPFLSDNEKIKALAGADVFISPLE